MKSQLKPPLVQWVNFNGVKKIKWKATTTKLTLVFIVILYQKR